VGVTPQASFTLLVALEAARVGRWEAVLLCGNGEVRKRKLFGQGWMSEGCEWVNGS